MYGSKQLLDNKYKIRTFILCCFLLKLLTSAIYFGFETDMACFYGWSYAAFEGGFSNFYNQSFADYPPGYIYILYILGGILKLFRMSFDSLLTPILLKTPAILCDVLTGYLIYKIARKRFKEKTAIIFMLLYVFNPAIYINSSVWGQVDSVFTLFALYMLYSLTEEKYSVAIMSFAIGALIKPQIVFFLPVLCFVCFKGAFLYKTEGHYRFKFNSRKFTTILLWAVLGIGSMLLLMCPFGLDKVFDQYFRTVGSYNYASVNAYNIWTLFGQNWVEQEKTLLGIPFYVYGYAMIVIAVVISGFIYFKSKLNEESKIYLSAAFNIITIFLFSVRMHERYLFPAIALLLLVYLAKPSIKLYVAYVLFSIAHFYNVSHTLFFFDSGHYDWEAAIPKTIAFFSLLVYGFFISSIWQYCKDDTDSDLEESNSSEFINDVDLIEVQALEQEDKQINNKKIPNSKAKEHYFISQKKNPFTKNDWLVMLFITVVYALIAFYNLGYNYAPETAYTVEKQGTTLYFDFPEGTQLSKVSIYNGYYDTREFQINCFNTDAQEWVRIAANDTEEQYPVVSSVFKWNPIELTKTCDPKEQDTPNTDTDTTEVENENTFAINGNISHITMISKSATDPTVLLEMVFLDADGNKIVPTNSGEYPALFDEQDLYDPTESYRSGTYFDEIYHARTAYEFLHGLPTYEWTHPPLGKILISIGVSIFGMNPFGWRFMGTLFGVLMLPCIFLFARRIFKKTWLAGVTCLLFAVDFMHFAQTRIATIDVYVTFFIILMYYFMYQYVTTSYYDKKLYKSLIPLALCGISTGLAVASKVTGAYAALGLGVIFFINLYHRYKEYRYACLEPDESTNGISHSYVINKFKKNTLITILFCVLVFIIIPFIIYTLSYIPFIDKYANENLGLLERMWKNQSRMFDYHSDLDATHPFSSTWYQWPILYRPIYYFARDISSSLTEGISSFGNPLIWWSGIAAFFGTIYFSIRRKDRRGTFLIIAFLAQYLPWVLVSRCTFIYHYFPSVPFVILMIVFCIYHLKKKYPKLLPWIILFLALTVILFFMFYPVLSGMSVYKWYVDHFLRWFGSWVLAP